MSIVVGIKSIISKKDSTPYVELHFLSEDRYVNGHRCDTVFVRKDMITNVDLLELNSEVDVLYNRFGRVESVIVK